MRKPLHSVKNRAILKIILHSLLLVDKPDRRSHLYLFCLQPFLDLMGVDQSPFIRKTLCKKSLKIHSNVITFKSRANNSNALDSAGFDYSICFQTRAIFCQC